MINISTYTELVPAAAAVNEPPQITEDNRSVESSEFAQLLAGLLQNTEKIQTEIPLPEFSEPDFNFEAMPSIELNEANDKFTLTENSEKIPETAEEENSDVRFKESGESYGEQINVLASGAVESVENLLSGAKADIAGTGNIQLDTDYSETITNLQEVELTAKDSIKNDHLLTEFFETASLSVNDEINTEKLISGQELQKTSLQTEKLQKDNNPRIKDHTETLSDTKVSETLKKPEGEKRSKLDETRSQRHGKFTFDVHDHRTGNDAVKTQRNFTAAETVRRTGGEAPAREISLELRITDQNGIQQINEQPVFETRSGNNGSVNSAMENLLARELHQNFNGDIVRHASMALRDGGEGIIRLNLKPESLGNVKIHLDLSENKITGHIVVESKEALNAFRKELASLEQAFKDSGFANAELNLSLSSEGQNNQMWEQEADSFSHQFAASRYDNASFIEEDHTLAADVLFGQRHGSINMLA